MEQKSAISCTLRTPCTEAKSSVPNIVHAGHPPPSLEEHFLCGPLPLQSSASRSTLGPSSCYFAEWSKKVRFRAPCERCVPKQSQGCQILCMQATLPPPSKSTFFAVLSLCSLPLQEAPCDRLPAALREWSKKVRFRAPCERCVSKQSQGSQILCMQATLPPPSKSTFFAVPSLCSLPPPRSTL